MWEELYFLRPIPNCTCGNPCKCGLSKVIAKYKENEYVICFLKGLNEVYNTIKTQILLIEPLPNINKVFSLVMQHERHVVNSSNNTIENKAFINTTYKNSS